VNQPSSKEKGNNNNNNYRYSDNNNNNHGLDLQDKSFINGIKITDVDRSNPHLLKVTLERTHNNNGNQLWRLVRMIKPLQGAQL